MEKCRLSLNRLSVEVPAQRRLSDSRLPSTSEDLLPEPVSYDGSRKHSCGDLQSRLKTRKLLGVGGTNDGDVHRSKISQILGHSEQLYVTSPRGLWIWQAVGALLFAGMGLWAFLFPTQMLTYALSQEASETCAAFSTRLYGATLTSFAVIFWTTLRSTDRDVIQWALLSCTLYFILQIIATLISSLSSLLTVTGFLTFVITIGCIWLNIFFYKCMRRQSAKETWFKGT